MLKVVSFVLIQRKQTADDETTRTLHFSSSYCVHIQACAKTNIINCFIVKHRKFSMIKSLPYHHHPTPFP